MIYRFGEVTFDSSVSCVRRGGHSIRLRPKVFRVCLYLLEHRDRVISREELCTEVWGGRFVSQATLEGVIRSIRQALGDNGRTQRIIQTSRGYGYRFAAGVEEQTHTDVVGEAPSAEALSGSPESDILVGPARLAAGVEVARGREATSTIGPWGMVKGRQGLAVMALVLVGAFGLWWGTSHEGMGPQEESRLAVLPLIDLSAAAKQGYLADGIMQELIIQLSQIPGLTVVDRTPVQKYKGSLKDVATIGRELGVRAILEGSIRKMDNQVRVSVQLIDVASQGHLWSQEYTRELTGVFATQSDIATHLAQRLRVQLTAQLTYNRMEGGPWVTALAHKIGLVK